MRNLLVIADTFPCPDQASGDLRFFTLLSLLTRNHKLLFCALNTDGTTQPCNDAGARLAEKSGVDPIFTRLNDPVNRAQLFGIRDFVLASLAFGRKL
ncbi:MAG: hypothetical protein K8R50_06575 [Betaproteobacteria bacterium]|nr:hypothetical protein [Betaproteobacteria bacterium]